MTTLAGWMVENTTVVAIAIPFVLLLTMCRKHRPAEHNLYWLLLLVKLVLPPFYVWPVSGAELREGVVRLWKATHAVDSIAESLVAESLVAESLVVESAIADVAAGSSLATRKSIGVETHELAMSSVIDQSKVAQESTTVPPTSQIAEQTSAPHAATFDFTSLPEWLAAAWLLGTAIVAWRLTRHVLVQRLVILNGAPAPLEFTDVVHRLSHEIGVAPIGIRISEHVESPSIACLGRPILIWPSRKAALAPGHDFEGVILHELAHIRRKDHWVAWLELGATLVAWWNPVYWFVRRQMHESRELACDAAVMHLMPGCRREYAELLLYFCSQTPPVQWAVGPVQTGFLSRHALKRRLKMIFNDRVSSRTSMLGFVLTALIAALSFPGWVWSQSREERPQAANELSAAPPSFTAAETAAPETPAQPGAPEAAPAAELPASELRPETTSGPGNQRFAPAREGASELGDRPAEPQPGRPRMNAPGGNRMIGPAGGLWGRKGRSVPDTAAPDGDDVIQEVPVTEGHSKVRIRTTPQGVVVVELDEGGGRVRSFGPFNSIGTTPPGWLWDATSRRFVSRFDGTSPPDMAPAGVREDNQPGSRPKSAQPGARDGAHRSADAATGPSPMNAVSKRGQRDPVSDLGVIPPAERQQKPTVVATPPRQYLLVELAKIDVEEKTIELESARDELAVKPDDAKLQRKLKLATLAVRRAEIQLGLAEKSGPETNGLGRPHRD